MRQVLVSVLFFFSLNVSAAVQVDALIQAVWESDVLADFWYGDDGEDCFEPFVQVLSHDPVSQTLEIEIQKDGLAIGCYETNYICSLSYQNIASGLKIQPLDIIKDCR